MTIKTLTLIHKLLVEKEAITNADYKHASMVLRNAEEAESKDVFFHEEKKENARKAHLEAQNALEDFESRDWH